MIQPSDQSGFPAKALYCLLILLAPRGDEFHGNISVASGVKGHTNPAHATMVQPLSQFKGAESAVPQRVKLAFFPKDLAGSVQSSPKSRFTTVTG
jgi:hypothetical protein